MNEEQLKERIKEDLGQMLEAHGIKADLSEHHVEKLNASYDALSVTPEGSRIGVNANLSAICEAIDDGQSYSEVVARAADSIIAGIENTPEINVEDLTNYDEMKSKLAMEVVSADRNAEMLENVPHEQLHDDAMVNAPEIRPSEIRGRSVVMTEMMGPGMIPENDPADEQMFVASVSDNIHGAGVIAYLNFFEDAAEKLGGDFYVLPSSIHEVLLVGDNGEMTAKDLEALVREVNATQVAPQEQLTDHVYHTVDNDVGMNISGLIVAIGMSNHQCPISGKHLLCKFQTDCLCSFSGKSILCNIGRIVADNVVVTFDIFTFLIFVKMSICQFAFLVKRHRITVQSIHVKLFSQDASPGFIYNLFPGFFIMFKQKVIDSI